MVDIQRKADIGTAHTTESATTLASGKSTIAVALESALLQLGKRSFRLDGKRGRYILLPMEYLTDKFKQAITSDSVWCLIW
jgi:adenylylsulfate kinase-like enzyme